MHAYDLEGKPHHFVKTKKRAKNPTRPTRASDLKENGWVPSVTTITSVLDQDWLTAHKCRQVAKACIASRPRGGEDENIYATRIARSVLEEAGEAAKIGDAIHAALEAHYTGERVPDTLTLYNGLELPAMDVIGPAIDLIDKEGIVVQRNEYVTVNPKLGYAGTVDMLCRKDGAPMLGDFKSKKTKKGVAIPANDLYACQLAAYYDSEFPCCIGSLPLHREESLAFNLYISTTEPGRVEIVYYTAEHLTKAFEAFKHMLFLWKWSNGLL